MLTRLQRWLPILDWGRRYDRRTAADDALAALIVTIMLVPQSLAYAMLAGLPPHVGLYASMLPLVAYALFGTSRVLAVGPAAVTSLMTAAAASQIAVQGSPEYLGAALLLALLSGVLLMGMGLLRLGFLANFLSHPVIAGFMSASAILIAVSQLKYLFGIPLGGDTLLELLPALLRGLPALHLPTLLIGVGTLAFLYWVRRRAKSWLCSLGMGSRAADMLVKTGPVLAILATTLLVRLLQLDGEGVRIVGVIPQGLPALAWPTLEGLAWTTLVVPALLISVVGFVESVSVGQTFAARRRQRIEPDQELVALGASNLASAVSGGLPVTGGFSRTVVSYDAGAQTPATGVLTAIGLGLVTAFLTPALYFLPQATLAATIIVAVLALVDLGFVRRLWGYARGDSLAGLVTLLATLFSGVEIGLIAGVALSLLHFLYCASKPHIAELGRVPETEHFRNVRRHAVQTHPQLLSLRVDRSLFFANARYLEDRINAAVAEQPELRHLVLLCSPVNDIDASAMESLEVIAERLHKAGITLHLSEVKGPVMDKLQAAGFPSHLASHGGQIFLSHYQAWQALTQT